MTQKQLQLMPREHWNTRKGFSLIEVLLSIVVFAMLVTVFISSMIYGQESERLAGDRARATFLAQEGLEAVRNMRDENISNLANGNHGLAVSGNVWSFSGTSDVTDIFTRTIIISDIDTTTKLITSNITWKQNEQRNGSITLAGRLNNWKIPNPTQAEQLTIDLSNTQIGGGGNATISGLKIENIGIENITIVSTKISWSGVPSNRNLTNISIDSGSVWTGSDSSGSSQDISDFVLNLGAGTYPMDFTFSGSVNGISMTVEFTMLDGSTKTVDFTPGSPPDTTPPADITNLSTSGATTSSINLSWTAPGDDGNSGTASSYDIRYSTVAITSSNWSSATQVSGEPTPSSAGSSESMTISGLSPATIYYFAIKTSDEVPNESGLSNVPNNTTLALQQANYLVVNTAGRARTGNTITGITLQNSGSTNITIATMRVSWSGIPANRRLTSISINGASKWTGTATSGTVENITDTAIVTGVAAVPMVLGFNNTINGITASIVFTMLDGSTKTISGIGPL